MLTTPTTSFAVSENKAGGLVQSGERNPMAQNYWRSVGRVFACALVLAVSGQGWAKAQDVAGQKPVVPQQPPGKDDRLPPPNDEPEPYDDSGVIGISAPVSMAPGSTAYASVSMRNTGNTTWSGSVRNPYRLGSQDPANNLVWGIGRVELGIANGPGGTAVFRFPITAPTAPGTYTFSWQMLREGYIWFGPVASTAIAVSAPAPAPVPVYDAQLTSASIPAQMTAGASYNVTLTFKNTGNVSWTQAEYRLGSTSPDDNYTWGLHRVGLSTASVAPGQSTTFSFSVQAPRTAGTYLFDWGMLWEYHRRFGQNARASVTVSPVASTQKPTISVVRPSLVAGRSFTTSWSTTDAAAVTHVCTAGGTGYTVNETLPVNGSRTMSAQAGWVNYPSSCTWTARGAGGSATFSETMTTIAATSSSVTYIHTDGLGSPIARTDAAGNVISRTRYEPYGYVASGATPSIGFTGHVNDSDTGLVYMQQRYYDPVAGRFLSIDPVVTDANTGGSFNRYAYANNSPYKYTDPDGRAAETVFDAASLALSIAIYKSDPSLLNGLGVAIDGLAMAVPFVPGGVGVIRSVGRGVEATKAAGKGGEGGRAANKLRPVEGAEGAHSAFKRGSDGKITHTATYTPNAKNPSGFDEAKRVDVTGKAHTNSDGTKVDTPHVHEAGIKEVRPAKPEELPSK